MIVQCKSCGTKFNFDETLIGGEGVWGRCSQCKNIFFLEKPITVEAQPDKEKNPETADTGPREEKREEVKVQPADVRTEIRKDIRKQEPLPLTDIEKDMGDPDINKAAGSEKAAAEKVPAEDKASKEKGEKKPAPARGRQLIYLFVLLLLGGVYFIFFAGTSVQMLLDRFLGTAQKVEEVGPAQVDLVDIRQRLVDNLAMGTIRVVEGTAVNRSSFPMARIKVRGEITDAYTVILGVRESYCGNLLTGEELATMTEEQIQRELSNPQGSDVSNDRIGSQGQIPFMIVFTREPPAVMKAFVVPVGAERLLP